ncbi:hypothetical protein M407DRAFT_120049 [Tulasnella calospora MUT 4182]|uniref:Uncharacterized protein n=1 Tax=Tulasnella calospora MUT 4182 TaxID=1051891 RepID=A0A0C3QCC3_9AGAM|nr:hypothetical protein M407DRAFT_120049 [Tulasnella calospora MUT 4182]
MRILVAKILLFDFLALDPSMSDTSRQHRLFHHNNYHRHKTSSFPQHTQTKCRRLASLWS